MKVRLYLTTGPDTGFEDKINTSDKAINNKYIMKPAMESAAKGATRGQGKDNQQLPIRQTGAVRGGTHNLHTTELATGQKRGAGRQDPHSKERRQQGQGPTVAGEGGLQED